MKEEPTVSVVIPTLNSGKTIEECLNSIINQTYQNIETIIVDGGSEDDTIEIAKNFEVKITEANIKSMTKQTNIGITSSSGDYIYRVDSDVILPEKMVETCVQKCEYEDYSGVCVFWLPDDSISFWAKVRKIEKENYIKKPNYVGATKYDKNVLGARFLKREVIDKVGLFNENIPTFGEDYALYNKLAHIDYQFALIDLRERHIGEPKSLTDVFKKNYSYGRAMRSYLKNRSGDDGIKQFSPFGRNYLLHAFKDSFRISIKLFIGLFMYLFVVYFSTALGVVNSIIKEEPR